MPPDVDLGFTKNEKYDRILRDYYHCSFTYLSQFEFVYQYEKQLKRRDVDTVCAFELYQMKKAFNESNLLDLSSFVDHQDWAHSK